MPVLPVKDEVEFGARIPRALYEEFKGFVPQYGGVQWFLNAALTSFVEHCKTNPTLVDYIDDSVRAMVSLNRMAGQTQGEETLTLEEEHHA